MRIVYLAALAALSVSPAFGQALEPPAPPPGSNVPDWALPQSSTHKQVAPPLDFHRPPRTFDKAVGQFDNATDVGSAMVTGNSSYDPATRTYTITSAGYNIWYQRDEFHYLWKKMNGDVSLAASIVWPDITEFNDRKVALVIRDSLNDDSREIMAAQHGNGMVHIAWRGETGAQMTDIEYRSARQPIAAAGEKGPQTFHPKRVGIEKKGDQFQLYVSWQGEPMHAEGGPVTFKTSGPFYVGVGFTSHLAAQALTAKVADVALENAAGKVR
jgi:hypothetical protein